MGGVERLAREAEPEFDIVVAAGGDGTINAAANGLAGGPRPLGILPLGTANVLARELGLPRGPDALAELIAAAPARPVWPGRIGDRLFLAMASCGFDAETVAAVRPALKRRLGRFAFAWAMLGCLSRYRPCEVVVRADGAEYRASTMIASRARFYAGPFPVAPRASLDDPVLDLVLFQRAGRPAVLRYLAALGVGNLPRRPDILSVRCRSAEVSAAAPLPVQADGEIVGTLPVAIGMAPRPLYLVGP